MGDALRGRLAFASLAASLACAPAGVALAQDAGVPQPQPQAQPQSQPPVAGGVAEQGGADAGGAPSEGDQVEVIQPDTGPPPHRGVSVWTEPALLIFGAATGALDWINGVNIPLTRSTDLFVTLRTQAGNRLAFFTSAGVRDPLAGFSVGVGVSQVIPLSRRGLVGPFVQGRVVASYTHVDEHYDTTDGNGAQVVALRGVDEGRLGGALDLGFQFADKHFYAAVYFGFTATYCWNCTGEGPTAGTGVHGDWPRFDLNFSFLRLGYTF